MNTHVVRRGILNFKELDAFIPIWRDKLVVLKEQSLLVCKTKTDVSIVSPRGLPRITVCFLTAQSRLHPL